MRRFAFVLAVLGSSNACDDDKLGPMRAIKSEMCACKTVECADAAMKRVPPPAGSADHRAQKLAREIQNCLVKAYDADRPTTDPDAETDDSESTEGSDSSEASAGDKPNPSIAPPAPSP